jgi:NADH:ubiquinone oxidoreductase subunit 5 (subunit L)/multisubunit Na+/H+ antiporter MnhA subunit
VALPFTSGYFSKELILLAGMRNAYSVLIIFLLLVGAIFTVVYSIRLLNNLRLVRRTTKITSIFEDLGRLISIMLVLFLSVLGGWVLHHHRFE